MSRFYYHPALVEAETISLSREESRHLKANRIEPGATVQLTDGKGNLFSGIVSDNSSQLARIEILKKNVIIEENYKFWVWQPLLKNWSRLDWLIEKLSEVGVSGIGLFRSERCIREKIPLQRKERWEKIIIEACKQSGRTSFPPLVIAENWDHFLVLCHQYDMDRVVGDPNSSSPLWNYLIAKTPPFNIQLIVGPEGDFSFQEKEHLQALAETRFIKFSSSILRSETASLFGAMVCIAGLESKRESRH